MESSAVLSETQTKSFDSQGRSIPSTIGWFGWTLVALSLANAFLNIFLNDNNDPIVDTGNQLATKSLLLIAVVYGLYRYRPENRRPWLYLGTFAVCGVILKFTALIRALNHAEWFYAVNDIEQLLLVAVAAIAIAAGSLSIMRGRRPREDWALADAWVIGLGFLLASVRMVSMPIYLEYGFNLAFWHLGVIAVLRVTFSVVPLIAIIFSEHLRNRSLQCYCVGAFLAFGAEQYFLAVHGAAVFPGLAKTLATTGINFGQAFLALAAILPSMREIATPATAPRLPWNGWRTVFLACAVLTPIIVSILFPPLADSLLEQIFIVGLGVLLIAMCARMRVAIKATSRTQTHLEQLALRDELTGLPNRRYMNGDLVARLEQEVIKNGSLTLVCCYVDIDNLKEINDQMGHRAGDALIQGVGRALQSLSSTEDSDAIRVGGDEFIVLARMQTYEADTRVLIFSQRVFDAINELKVLSDAPPTTASVGVSWKTFSDAGPPFEQSFSQLLNRADLAQVEAKRGGGARIKPYDEAFSEEARRATNMNRHIVNAWSLGEMHLAYQPVVNLESSLVYGAEALLRWDHPDLGPISPLEAIRTAERQGVIQELGLQILELALADIARLPEHQRVRVGVNLSGHQLQRHSIKKIIDTIAESGLGRYLWLEITEQAIVESRNIAAQALQELRRNDVLVAIDDFGTGYCGLDYLCTLPVDIVKLDGVFARESLHSETRQRIIRLGVQLAESIGAVTLAEGIEDAETGQLMRQLGCVFGQGYAYGRPMRGLAQAIAGPPQLRAVALNGQ